MQTIFHQHTKNGRINIPDFTRRIKIDIGTSCNAPHSEHWLQNDNQCCVFAFEPNPFNIESINSEGGKMWPVWLKSDRINKSFFCFHCALSNYEAENQDFYCTLEDGGTSSLFIPKIASVKSICKVDVVKLSSFFDIFPWEKFPFISQLKVDAQSSDYNILLGAGDYLYKIVYIDIETHTNNQYHNSENPDMIMQYLTSKGFRCLSWGINATFVNQQLEHLKDECNYLILSE